MSDSQPPTSPGGQISPDGQFQWNGTAWVPNPNLPKPKKKHTARNVIIIIVVLFVAGIAGCVALVGGAANEVSKSITNDSNRAAKDVTLSGCRAEKPQYGYTGFDAKISVHNTEKKTQDYSVEVLYTDASGTRVGDGYAEVDHLAPGETGVDNADDPDVKGKIASVTCKLGDVTAIETVSK